MVGKILSQFNQIKQRDLNRREFLVVVGLSIISIVGVTDIVRILGGESHTKEEIPDYNSGYYGG
jgi:hypothetical protein